MNIDEAGSDQDPSTACVDVKLDAQFSWSDRATAGVGGLLAVGIAAIALEQMLEKPLLAVDVATNLGTAIDAMALGIAVLTFAALSSRNRADPDRLNLVTAGILAVLACFVLPLDLVSEVAGTTTAIAVAIATRIVIVALPLAVNFRVRSNPRVSLTHLMVIVLVATVAIATPIEISLRIFDVRGDDVLGVALPVCAGLALLSALRLGALSLRHDEPRGYVLALTLLAIGVADGHASLIEAGSLSTTAGKVMRLVVISAILVYTVVELRDLVLHDRERALLAQGESERAADRLVAEMSFQERFVHDARNALLAIQGGLRSLSSGDDLEMVASLTSEVERLRLLLAGDNNPLPATFDLLDALGPMISCYQAAERQIGLIASGPMLVRGRPSVAAEVTQNLIENALVYGGGGEITVWIFERADVVEVRVADRGDGVDLDLGEEIFDHGTSGGSGSGSGVGLHISRRLVEQQGGTLEVSTRHGGGSIFSFTLPRATYFESTWTSDDRVST